MILAEGKENGLNWSLDAKGMNIYIRVIQDSTKKEFIKKYECQFEPTWGYDISDVNAVNKMLDDMIEVYTRHMNDDYEIGETLEAMAFLTQDEYMKLKENEQLKAQVASMKKALNLILGYSKNGCIYFIEEIAKEALSEDVTEKYHNPADITLLRKAKDCLKHGIKQLEKYINYFEQTPEEDACIEMHETVLEIDKILASKR